MSTLDLLYVRYPLPMNGESRIHDIQLIYIYEYHATFIKSLSQLLIQKTYKNQVVVVHFGVNLSGKEAQHLVLHLFDFGE